MKDNSILLWIVIIIFSIVSIVGAVLNCIRTTEMFNEYNNYVEQNSLPDSQESFDMYAEEKRS